MRAKQKQDQLKNKITSVTGMPDEVILGASVINILGYHKLYIENYRGILEYTSCLIRIQTKQTQIRVVGKKLKIEYYTNLEMKITGDICSIEFCNKEFSIDTFNHPISSRVFDFMRGRRFGRALFEFMFIS